MAAQRQYATAGAFRTALEARLNERTRQDGVDLHRLRRQVAFDRLLARMNQATSSCRYKWLRGHATSGTCSCGAGRHEGTLYHWVTAPRCS
jgi:hypothetical protein